MLNYKTIKEILYGLVGLDMPYTRGVQYSGNVYLL
jgi:hypothetical protein